MAKREITPAAGLYKNGRLWWVRTVRAPIAGVKKPLSTGTAEIPRANATKAMVDTFAENPKQYEWLERAVLGDVSLEQLFVHHSAGTLHLLREQLAARAASAADDDLRPWVEKWKTEHLATLGISDLSKDYYERQVRFFIPADKTFPKSRLTEDYVKAQLATLTGARHDRTAKAGSSTKRRYIVGLQQFIRYAKKRVPLDSDPIADADWIPKNNSPRSVFHEYEKVQLVLAELAGEDRRAMTLIYGSGIELGAFLDMKAAHVGKTLADGRGTIVAPGSKNAHREERTIFVDAWAWPAVQEQVKNKLPMASLFSYQPGKDETATKEKDLREAFYCAQVKAGFIEQPVKSEGTGKLLWGRVKPHTIHDARHSYCVNRSLGLDGEEPQDASFCANQLGHADETMVLKIYKKANVKERLRLIQQQQIRKAAVKAAGEGR